MNFVVFDRRIYMFSVRGFHRTSYERHGPATLHHLGFDMYCGAYR